MRLLRGEFGIVFVGIGILFMFETTFTHIFVGRILCSWEKNYAWDIIEVIQGWSENNPVVPPVVAVGIYLVFITVGPYLMKDREAFNFRKSWVRTLLNLCGLFFINTYLNFLYRRLYGICFYRFSLQSVSFVCYRNLFIIT